MTLRLRPDWSDVNVRLIALLAVLTIVPAACVLWFMSAAMASDSAVAQQRVLGAYRGQLRLVRSRLDALWRQQAERLNAPGEPAREFQRLISGEVAEGAILLDASGYVAFPWTDVRGDLAELETRVAAASRLAPGVRAAAVQPLADRLNDYGRRLPAGDRLRLMDDLRALSPNVRLPTQAALRLSLDMVDSERPEPSPGVVRKTSVPDVWALTSADRRTIGLYRTGRIEAILHDFLHQVSPAGIVFVAYPPGETADMEAIAAGPWLPGWQLSFVPLDETQFADDDRRRRTINLAVALGGVAIVVAAVASGGRLLRQYLQVARLKTDLVAAASHELRTPLASMRVLVDGLLADRELDPVKTRDYLQLLVIENDRLTRSIDNFLAISRLERSQQRFTLVPVSPGDLVAAAVSAIRNRVPGPCELRVDLAPDLPPVMADPAGVTTALANLLDNAVKYSPGQARVTISARRDGEAFVSFCVADNGIGIAHREQRRIFRQFYRVDQRLASPTSGIGLGLSIVDLVARGHGGRVTVASRPGAGSTFTLRLRTAAGETTAGQTAAGETTA